MSGSVAPVPVPSADLRTVPSTVGSVRRLVGRPVGADWGDARLLVGLADLDEYVDPRPVAEVWYGAHARHPSWVVDGAARIPADTLLPQERPEILVKLLAAAGPLSIQVHPDAATARRRWEEEEAAGIPRDARERRSADPFAKPELIRALGPFRALCGFRPAGTSRALLTALVPRGAEPLLELLAHGDGGLGVAVATVLRAGRCTVDALLDAVVTGAQEVVAAADGAAPPDMALDRLARLALDLVARFPGDPGVLVALLLEDVDLAAGDALFVAPGTPHAYLSGLAVEVMAPSDNVARGGMTSKPVDVDAFLDALDTRAVGVPRTGTLARRIDGTGWRRHISPSEAFVLDEVELDGALHTERMGHGPSIVLCVDGEIAVTVAGGAPVELRSGDAALLIAGLVSAEVRGRGLVLHAGAASGASPISPAGSVPTTA